MGIVAQEVVFRGRAPRLSEIADKVAELSGMPLSAAESAADVQGDLYDLHGRLAFACAPGEQVTIYAYRGGAVRTLCDEMFGNVHLPMAEWVQGNNEPAGTQSVYLKGYAGQEPTLLAAITLALEALGGRPKDALSREWREYGAPVTPALLEDRRRKWAKGMWLGVAAGLLLAPLTIPLGLVALVVMTPWRVWKGYKAYRSFALRGGPAAPGPAGRRRE